MVTAETDSGTGRRLIIHCGVQKTGSTSLHHFVQRNSAALARRLTVLTPAKGSLTRDLGRGAMRFSLSPTPERRARLAGLAQQLCGALHQGAGPVLISHENLLGAMIGKQGTTTLYPQLEEILSILEDGFQPFRPEFVIYTREMAAWKDSVYGQAVKSDHYPHSRAAFLSETRDCGTWAELEQRLLTLLGRDRLRVFRLEDEPDMRWPARQLLTHAGLTAAEIEALEPMPGPSNTALKPGALEFLRRVNGLGLDRAARRRVAALVTGNQSLFAS